MASQIGVPSTSGIKDALINYAVGMAGGVGYAIGSSILGSGLIGSAGTAALVGSFVKGSKGDTLAMILGFQAIVGGGLSGGNSGSADDDDEM